MNEAEPNLPLPEHQRFQCATCGKWTAGRQHPDHGVTWRYPRRHAGSNGAPCLGNDLPAITVPVPLGSTPRARRSPPDLPAVVVHDVQLFTDGSARGEQAAWAYRLVTVDTCQQASGTFRGNALQAELEAIWRGLAQLPKNTDVTVVTDLSSGTLNVHLTSTKRYAALLAQKVLTVNFLMLARNTHPHHTAVHLAARSALAALRVAPPTSALVRERDAFEVFRATTHLRITYGSRRTSSRRRAWHDVVDLQAGHALRVPIAPGHQEQGLGLMLRTLIARRSAGQPLRVELQRCRLSEAQGAYLLQLCAHHGIDVHVDDARQFNS